MAIVPLVGGTLGEDGSDFGFGEGEAGLGGGKTAYEFDTAYAA